ncbi:hypothetical protein [Blastococcus sp. URHD0036]|uniref:hypothetical protein n=1 Tax=Blastococcus sp. URHD0036 TaxID=1380356 RepID=UPI00049680C5|nr:hypothetical protein [Blastococcus sp. URHD0036]
MQLLGGRGTRSCRSGSQSSQTAIRRAVELGNVWIPFPHPRSDHALERHSDPLATADDLPR